MQKSTFDKAKAFLIENTRDAHTYDQFKEIMNTTRGFIRAFWCEDAVCEAEIKGNESQYTLPAQAGLPLNSETEKGVCIHCGKPANHKWLFAQSY